VTDLCFHHWTMLTSWSVDQTPCNHCHNSCQFCESFAQGRTFGTSTSTARYVENKKLLCHLDRAAH